MRSCASRSSPPARASAPAALLLLRSRGQWQAQALIGITTMSASDSTRRWNLPSIEQPPEGTGIPGYGTEVVPGRRYRFEVTGTVSTEPGRHICSAANLQIADDAGKIHYLNGYGLLRAQESVQGWPPQPGDTWKDEEGVLWFVFESSQSRVLEMVSAQGGELPAHCEPALRMALVTRGIPA
jgi:hypothetical protein